MSKNHYIIPIFVPHEGCPHSCVFCNQDHITGSSVKVDAVFVKETVETYLKTIGTTEAVIEVSFFGGTFTAIPIHKQEELLKVAQEYKKKNKIQYIRLSTRPDYINDTILRHLKAYDVDIIELGVQSLDEEVLLKSGRGHSKEDVLYASKLIQKYDFILGHQIMLGLPGDTFKKDIITTLEIIKLKPKMCRIYPALVIRDTAMEHMYKSGKYSPYTLEEAIFISKIIYGMLTAHKIQTIRIGLQPTDGINEGADIVVGPFHPAFRELVEGSIYNDALRENIPHNFQGEVQLRIHSKCISKLYAYKKKFFLDTKKQVQTFNLKVIQDNSIEKDLMYISYGDTCKMLSVLQYMIKKYTEGNFKGL